MKGGLCIIYTSLLTISVISSCALFILTVSEALQADGDDNAKVDLSGLHNVSHKVTDVDKNVQKTTAESRTDNPEVENEKKVVEPEMIFAETLSLNSVTTDGCHFLSEVGDLYFAHEPEKGPGVHSKPLPDFIQPRSTASAWSSATLGLSLHD